MSDMKASRGLAAIRDELRAFKPYHVQDATGMVKLDAMENPYRLPDVLRVQLSQRLSDAHINRYPDPDAARFKALLRERMRIGAGLGLMVGNGSDELLNLLTIAVAKPGATVLSLEPSFAMYKVYATITGVRYVGVPLNADFTLPVDAFLRAIEQHQPALTWIAYPNNPTGNLFPAEAIRRVIDAAPGIVGIDEAYFAFAGGASFLRDVGRYDNVIVVRTLSKLGLAGARLGFAVGPASLIAEIDKIRSPYNVGIPAQVIGEFALEHDAVLSSQADKINAERSRLAAELRAIVGVTVFESAANFLLIRVPDAPRAFEGLKAHGILIRTFHATHPLLAHCLRVTVSTPDENNQFLAALKAVV